MFARGAWRNIASLGCSVLNFLAALARRPAGKFENSWMPGIAGRVGLCPGRPPAGLIFSCKLITTRAGRLPAGPSRLVLAALVLNLGFENAAPGRVGRGAGGASAAEKKLNKSEEGMRPLVIRVPPPRPICSPPRVRCTASFCLYAARRSRPPAAAAAAAAVDWYQMRP